LLANNWNDQLEESKRRLKEKITITLEKESFPL